MALVFLVSLVALGGCAEEPLPACPDGTIRTAWSDDECIPYPSRVRIDVLRVQVTPVDFQGCAWDLFTCSGPDPQTVRAITDTVVQVASRYLGAGEALTIAERVGAYDAVIDAISNELTNYYAQVQRPDLIGVAGVWNPSLDDYELLMEFDGGEDQNPSLRLRSTTGGDIAYLMNFSPQAAVSLWVYDEDVASHDEIGSAVVRADDILAAWSVARPMWVATAGPDWDMGRDGGVLGVEIEVRTAD